LKNVRWRRKLWLGGAVLVDFFIAKIDFDVQKSLFFIPKVTYLKKVIDNFIFSCQTKT